MTKPFIPLHELEVYQLARELSKRCWQIYSRLSFQDRKIMGDQFMEAVDSVGANIAEGYARYHYGYKVNFYYNSRGSLSEACDHWLELLHERQKVNDEEFQDLKQRQVTLRVKLNNFIRTQKP